MIEPLFLYQAPGAESPEQLIVDLRNGLVRFTMRGEPEPVIEQREGDEEPRHYLREGARAQMTLPASFVMRLVHALLQLPPVEDMGSEAKPFVLWFTTDVERDAFVNRLREAVPELGNVALDSRSRRAVDSGSQANDQDCGG